LKSNIIFKTQQKNDKFLNDEEASTMFMCIKKEDFLNLCNIFPQTAENIKRKAKLRRLRFMEQKLLF